MDKSYNDILDSVNVVRRIDVKKIYEAIEDDVVDGKNGESVPYTMQDELMSSITQTCKTQFGASFDAKNNPMIYYPEDADVKLTGTIGSMNNAKFMFRYKEPSGNGCYVWIDPLQLTDDTLRTLSVIYGVYKNWRKELSTAEDIKPMGMKNNV